MKAAGSRAAVRPADHPLPPVSERATTCSQAGVGECGSRRSGGGGVVYNHQIRLLFKSADPLEV